MEHEEVENRNLIEHLRKRLLSRGPELTDFNEKDLDRVQQNDLYVWLFLKSKHKDLDKAMEAMVECLRGRKTFGINELLERNIDRRLFEIGFLYPRNKDKNGNPLLVFHTRLYKKELYDLEEVKKLFAFGLEKMATSNMGKKLTLIFDMQDASLANMDLELMNFIITTCFHVYFPCLLEYLIVFETPWILSAAWKIVKTWLSTEGISKIKFVNKTEILQYVSRDQLLKGLGGDDDFAYTYPPQLFSGVREMKDRNRLELPSKVDVFSSMSMSLDHSSSSAAAHNDDSGKHKKNEEVDFTSIDHSCVIDKNPPGSKGEEKVRRRRALPSVVNNHNKGGAVESAGPLVTISPANELLFCGPSPCTSEIHQILRITNTVSSTVAFKIKTTSPENFRVRPSSGPIPARDSIEINIFLQPGHEARLSKDKFLILSTIIPEGEKYDSSGLWKNLPASSIIEHRLRCRYEYVANVSNDNSDHDSLGSFGKKMDNGDSLFTIANQFIDFNIKLNDVENKLLALDKDLKRMFHLVGVLLFGLILTFLAIVVYLWRDSAKI